MTKKEAIREAIRPLTHYDYNRCDETDTEEFLNDAVTEVLKALRRVDKKRRNVGK